MIGIIGITITKRVKMIIGSLENESNFLSAIEFQILLSCRLLKVFFCIEEVNHTNDRSHACSEDSVVSEEEQ